MSLALELSHYLLNIIALAKTGNKVFLKKTG